MTPPVRRLLTRAAAAVFLTALGASVAGGMRNYLARRRENRQLVRKVAESEAAASRKRALLEQTRRGDDVLEGEARRQLGLIGEGEIEFRFVPSSGSSPETMETSRRDTSG